MGKKIVIAGGTGFIGEYLTGQFLHSNDEVLIISRQEPHISWNDKEGLIRALEGASILINLSGKSIDCRYTEKNKEGILKSRIETTKALGEAILKCKTPPELWINASAATFYRDSKDRPMTESTGQTGSSFSSQVAQRWEHAFFSFQLPETRQIALRISIALGSNGGIIKPYRNLVRFGLGGKQGSGNQMVSWIHSEDLYRIILFLHSHTELNGAFNCSAPFPVDNKTFMRAFRKVMHVKPGLPAPSWLIKIGAFFIGTEPGLVLESRWVVPERLLINGYEFKYPKIEEALNNILHKEE